MERYFNTTGVCDERLHYMLPPEERLPGLDRIVERQQYFVLHAPRQTGKTTAMWAFARRLRDERRVVALYATLEACQGVQDVAQAEALWIDALIDQARPQLDPELRPPPVAPSEVPGNRLKQWLAEWCEQLGGQPLVLLLDEADVVTGPAMVSLLRQLRSGFTERLHGRFPTSIALIGLRDLRDYLVQAKDGGSVNPGSPFNIKSASLTLRGFSVEEVGRLVGQHTRDTGQAFEPDAVDRLCWWTRGQPFLVNALAGLCVDDLVPDRGQPVSRAHIDEACQQLILARTTHLDSLAERLRDPEIAGIVEAIILGEGSQGVDTSTRAWERAVDLGLVGVGPEGAEVANPMYREVLLRVLTKPVHDNLPLPWWPWLRPDGGLDVDALVTEFQGWWRRHADVIMDQQRGKGVYTEAFAHIAFMGFLQRVVNGGGHVHREYAVGRGRVDVLVEFGGHRHLFELKRVPPKGRTLEQVLAEGKAQLRGYLDTIGLDEGWLVVFDQRPGRSWEERCTRSTEQVEGKRLRLVGG